MSWLDELTRRARTTIAETVESVSAIFRRQKSDDSEPIIAKSKPEQDETPTELNIDSALAETPDSEPRYVPEPIDPEDFGEDREPNPDFELHSESEFETTYLRRIFFSASEAEDYASEIPVPTEVFQRSEDLLYQVVVTYP